MRPNWTPGGTICALLAMRALAATEEPARAVLRELQPRARLVPLELAHPELRLEGTDYNFRPNDSQTIGRWQLRVQLALLLPTKKPTPKPGEEEGASAARIPPPPVTAQGAPGH